MIKDRFSKSPLGLQYLNFHLAVKFLLEKGFLKKKKVLRCQGDLVTLRDCVERVMSLPTHHPSVCLLLCILHSRRSMVDAPVSRIVREYNYPWSGRHPECEFEKKYTEWHSNRMIRRIFNLRHWRSVAVIKKGEQPLDAGIAMYLGLPENPSGKKSRPAHTFI